MRLLVVVSLFALAFAGGSFAAQSALKDPSQLILQRSDMPAGAQYTQGPMPANYINALKGVRITARASYFHVTFRNGGKNQTVSGLATTTGSTSQAQNLFKLSKDDMVTSRKTPLSLPSYGNEQTALIYKTLGKIELLVRTNRTVWEVETEVGFSKAALVAELKKYAAKFRQRVGAG